MKNYGIRIAGALLAALLGQGFCYGGWSAEVPAGVTEIVVEAGDRVAITLAESSAGVSAELLYGPGENAVSFERKEGRLLVRVAGAPKGSRPKGGKMHTGLKLTLPAGRTVKVSGANLVLSGVFSAKRAEIRGGSLSLHALKAKAGEMLVEAPHADLDLSLSGASRLDIKSSGLTGRATVPAGTQVTGATSRLFKLVRNGAKI